MVDDNKIINACLAGDSDCFRGLVEEYQTPLIRIAYRFLHNWDDAGDAAQETFIRAYRALNTFNQKNRFFTWLYRICINLCLDRRKSAAYRKQSDIKKKPLKRDENHHNLLDTIAEKELLTRAIRQLPIKRQKVIILMELEEMNTKETAEIMQISESTVRVTRMKARQQLRNIYLKLSKV